MLCPEVLPDPAGRPLAQDVGQRAGACADMGSDVLVRLPSGDHGVRELAVRGDVPTAPARRVEQFGAASGHARVDRQRRGHAMAVEEVEQAEDADAQPVFTPTMRAVVRLEGSVRIAKTRIVMRVGRRRQGPVLQMDDRADRDPLAVRQRKRRPVGQRAEGIERMVHAAPDHPDARGCCARYQSAIWAPVAIQTSSCSAMWRSARSSARMRCGWPEM